MNRIGNVFYRGHVILDVDPPERGPDVLHFLLTGSLLGGRSLEGVTWEYIDDPEYDATTEEKASELMKSIRGSRHD